MPEPCSRGCEPQSRTTVVPIRVVYLVVALTLSTVDPGWAQPGQGGLSGMVTDQTGGALPGTTISVRGADGAIEVASTTANDQGRYRIDGLPPGRYLVEYRAPQLREVAAGRKH